MKKVIMNLNLKKMRKTLNFKRLMKISKKSFVRNVFTVASGTVAAQAIVMLFSPIITRLYGPEAFGVLGVFTSIVAIVTTIAALTYPIAIVLPKKDSDAKNLMKLSLLIAIVMSTFTAFTLIFWGSHIVELLQIEVLSPYLLLIPLVMLFAAGRQVMNQWLIREKQFKVTAKVSVAQAFIVNSTKAGAGLFYPVGTTLIFIASIGHLLHTMMLAWGARKPYLASKINKEHETPNSILDLAKNYSDFPIYRAPQVFIAAITQSMPILMLTALFGPAAAGFYAIGNRVLGLPSQLIGKAVGDVFYPRIAEAAQKSESISKLLIKATLSMAVVGFIPFGLVIIFGPVFFSFVFGEGWGVAGVYASWMALWSYALFISKPSIKTLPVLSAQRFHLFFTIINIAVRGSALIIGGYVFESDVIAIALFGISGALLSVVLTVLTITKSRIYDAKMNTLNSRF